MRVIEYPIHLHKDGKVCENEKCLKGLSEWAKD